jgi:hypothetical protein
MTLSLAMGDSPWFQDKKMNRRHARIISGDESFGAKRTHIIQALNPTTGELSAIEESTSYFSTSFTDPHVSISSPKYGLRICSTSLSQYAPVLSNAIGQYS